MLISQRMLTATVKRMPFQAASVKHEVDMVDGEIRITLRSDEGQQILMMSHNETVQLVRDLVLYLTEDS